MKHMSQKSLWLLILVLVISAFALVNVCMSLTAERFDLSLDMTASGLYALSEDTKALVSGLEEATSVYVFSAESDYPSMYREILRRYAQLGEKLSVTYVDPVENPVLVSHFNQRGVTPSSFDILVEGAKRLKLIAYADTYVTDANHQVTAIDLEQQLTAALAFVNSEYTPRAVFTTGHNERPTSALEKLFADNSFTVETKSIAQDASAAPEIVVIAAPTADFTAQDLTRLRAWLAEGTRLMVFLEPGDADMPNLSALLAEYGMRFDNNVLFEPQAYAGAAAHNIIPMYTGHEINAYFADNPLYVVSPSTSSLTLEGVGTAKGRAQALLATTSAAYAKDTLHYTSSEQSAQDAAGQFTVAAIAENSVFVCGSRMIYADDLMATSSYANRMFLTRVVGALYSESVAVSIPAKTLDSALLAVSAGQARGLGILLTAILPAAALLCGVTIIIRRRRTL